MMWQSNLVKGILAILISSLGFTLMAMFIRLAGDVPLAEKAIFRNLITALIGGYFVWKQKTLFWGHRENRPLLLLRSVSGLLGILCGVYIFDHLMLSDSDIIGKLTSFILIAMSALVLKEYASKTQWLLCAVAFVGALFVIKPAWDVQFVPYLIGLVGAFFAADAYLCLRVLSKRPQPESPSTIVFFFAAFSSLLLLPVVIIDFQPLNLSQWSYLVLSGLCAAVGQYGVTLAYKFAAAKDISIYSYSSLLFSALLGYFVFNDTPDGWSLLGYAIIFFASFVMFYLTKYRHN